MILWLIFAAMAGASVLYLVAPLMRPTAPDGGAGEHAHGEDPAAAIYRSQLDDIDALVSRGQLGAAEAAAARGEIGRRLLKVQGQSVAPVAAPPLGARSRRVLGLILGGGLPVLAMAVYLSLGAPHLPGQNPARRAAEAKEAAQYRALVAQLEGVLASGKGDAQGWFLLGQAYRNLRQPAVAAKALERGAAALIAKGEKVPPRIYLARGEALMEAAGGVIAPAAEEAFRNALAVAPGNPVAQLYLALALGQRGDHAGARAALEALQKSLPKDSPLAKPVTMELKALEERAKAKPAPGP